jgi:hypothetical protein
LSIGIEYSKPSLWFRNDNFGSSYGILNLIWNNIWIGGEMHMVLSITTSIIVQFFFNNTMLILHGDIAFYTSFEIISGYKEKYIWFCPLLHK